MTTTFKYEPLNKMHRLTTTGTVAELEQARRHCRATGNRFMARTFAGLIAARKAEATQ